MYQSKFLLNRQKIFNPWEIKDSLASYLPETHNIPGLHFIYRLEWYRIGVVVPLLMYSVKKPEMQILKECQLIEVSEMEKLELAQNDYTDFSIFCSPDFENWNADNEEEIVSWLGKKLEKAGTIEEYSFGPNNTVYYDKDDKKFDFPTVTINGELKIKHPQELEKLRKQCFGKGAELGCGLLLIK